MSNKNILQTRDPVCGRKIDPDNTPRLALYQGRKVYFCSPDCMTSFHKDPNGYMQPKGLIGRFLAKLAKTNDKEFGDKGGPQCC